MSQLGVAPIKSASYFCKSYIALQTWKIASATSLMCGSVKSLKLTINMLSTISLPLKYNQNGKQFEGLWNIMQWQSPQLYFQSHIISANTLSVTTCSITNCRAVPILIAMRCLHKTSFLPNLAKSRQLLHGQNFSVQM